jgi:hypothetical protein
MSSNIEREVVVTTPRTMRAARTAHVGCGDLRSRRWIRCSQPVMWPVTKPAKREMAPVAKSAALSGRRGGTVGRMQAAVATAVAEDRD